MSQTLRLFELDKRIDANESLHFNEWAEHRLLNKLINGLGIDEEEEKELRRLQGVPEPAPKQITKIPFDWEILYNDFGGDGHTQGGTARVKVMGGWLVSHEIHNESFKSCSTSLTFVRDPFHEWSIEE